MEEPVQGEQSEHEANAFPEQAHKESEVVGISGNRQETNSGPSKSQSTSGWGMWWCWMSNCGLSKRLPDVVFRGEHCGQSMHVRKNPLFDVVRSLKHKLGEVDYVLREVKVAKGR